MVWTWQFDKYQGGRNEEVMTGTTRDLTQEAHAGSRKKDLDAVAFVLRVPGQSVRRGLWEVWREGFGGLTVWGIPQRIPLIMRATRPE